MGAVLGLSSLASEATDAVDAESRGYLIADYIYLQGHNRRHCTLYFRSHLDIFLS